MNREQFKILHRLMRKALKTYNAKGHPLNDDATDAVFIELVFMADRCHGLATGHLLMDMANTRNLGNPQREYIWKDLGRKWAFRNPASRANYFRSIQPQHQHGQWVGLMGDKYLPCASFSRSDLIVYHQALQNHERNWT
ncbi:MAG: hypothetical protein ACK4FZ_15250 [Vogesella sp.]|uniref:hypothetical protein n=1 Tax=Vogesella sp. TaxID=1904252 RepID=UPI00391BA530